MNSRIKTYFFVITLLAAYNFFFWGEKLGLNLMLFLSASAIAVIMLNSENLKSKNVLLSLLAAMYASAMVIVNNSGYSKFAAITLFMVFTGFAHKKKLRTVFNAMFTAVSSFVIFPYHIYAELKHTSGKYKPVRGILKIAGLVSIPLIFFVIFYSIYAYSNPVFNSYSVSFWDSIGKFLYEIFKDYPVLRFFYILLGLILIMGALFNRNISAFADIDSSFMDTLLRDKAFKVHSRTKPIAKRRVMYELFSYRFKFNTLRLENRMGLVLIFMMNALLLLLNIIDIKFTWLGFDSSSVDNLAYYVHNGTYLLIFSILLSMAILLFYFRGNQNYFSRNKLLKYGAYFWILQNAVMAVSVALRNMYYIEYYYALSYKRIGVMVFLLLTCVGLATILVKISGRKTTYWLFKVNSTALVIMLLIMSSFSWDKSIAEFNLSNPDKKEIDIEYLLRLSEDAYPILDRHRDVLNKDYFKYGFMWSDQVYGMTEFKTKVKRFMEDQKRYSWLSWNLPDEATYNYFLKSDLDYYNEENMMKIEIRKYDKEPKIE
ncbi:MAG: DUF4173 domain-containing protein [Ignavibacteria bacterium]|nr:DUF4173 domain-containing protein [Ignavibacteria bacterium]